MKKYFPILIIPWIIISNPVFSQVNSYHSIQEALNHQIEELKRYIGHFDHVFVVTNLDDSITLSGKVFNIESGINAKFIKKRDKDFLIGIKIATQLNYLKIDMTNFRVIKLSNKEIHLINLSSGHTYLIK